MKKVILFLWFGDEKPNYIQWTLDNFRQMNPGWEIRYIEYTTQQIINYKATNDQCLIDVMEKYSKKIPAYNTFINEISDKYRHKYLEIYKNELIIYCDLDCFPIAPFDNFIYDKNIDNKILQDWAQKFYAMFCPNANCKYTLGSCAPYTGGKIVCKNDIWCLTNNSLMTVNRFLQIHKNSIIDSSLVFHDGIIVNKQKISQVFQRNKDFHEMKIELGNNFCLSQFTPIEHYYSRERFKLNNKKTFEELK